MRINAQIHPSSIRLAVCLSLLTFASGCCCTNGWWMNNSGMGYYQKGNYALAKNEFQRAVIDDPKAPDYRHNLAMAMQKTGDVANAEQVLRHNLTVDPMHQPTYHALAQLLVSQQRLPEAEQLVTGWRDTQPYVPESYVETAWVQHEMGNRVAAEQSLRQALQIKPNHPIALAQLGQLYHESGQPDQAAALYQQSLLARWNQPEVHSRLATITGSTSSAVNMRRSAMLQNDAYVQTAMMPASPADMQPTMVSYGGTMPGTPAQAIAFSDYGNTGHRSQRRRMGRNSNERITAFPLPDYGMADAGMMQSNYVQSAAIPMNSTVMMSPPLIPEISSANQPQFMQPIIATNPPENFQADPAHAGEAMAGLPVVDPH